MSATTTTTVIEYTSSFGTVLYFGHDYWVDVELPEVRKAAAEYLFTNEDFTFTGDNKNGGYSINYGGGEVSSHNWRTLTLSAEDAADTNIIG